MARLFGRPPQSKNRDDKQTKLQQQQNAQNSPPQSSSSQGSSNAAPNGQAPLATFSAQFPPPEWLYDPRYFKPSSKHITQQQQQQHLFSKMRKSSKDAHGKDSNNIWVDLDPRSFKRDSTDGRFVSQRHVTCPENLAKNGGRWSPKHERVRNRQRPRLSKYMSSSSECLNYLAPSVEDDQHHYKDTKKVHKSKHKTAQNNNEAANLEKFTVTEPCENDFHVEPKKKSAPQTPVTPVSVTVPIVITTNINRNSIPDFTGRTSTPTKTGTADSTSNAVVIFSEITGQLDVRRENRDSAISSTSPVVTEMSSSDAKYSSWSGSDGHQDDRRNPLDHTYVNDQIPEKLADTVPCVDQKENVANHTYENVDKDQSLDSTQFENVTVDDEVLLLNNKNELLATTNNNEEQLKIQESNCPVKIRPTYISAV